MANRAPVGRRSGSNPEASWNLTIARFSYLAPQHPRRCNLRTLQAELVGKRFDNRYNVYALYAVYTVNVDSAVYALYFVYAVHGVFIAYAVYAVCAVFAAHI